MIFDKITSLLKKGLTARPQLEDDATREKLFWELLAEQFRDRNIIEHQDYMVLTPKNAFPIIINKEKTTYAVEPEPRRLLFLRLHPVVNYVHLESVRRGFKSLDDIWGKCYLTHCDAYIGKYAEGKPFIEFDEEGNPKTHPLEHKVTKVIREVFDMKYDNPLIFDYEKFCNKCDILHLNTRIELMDNSKLDLNDCSAYGM